MYKHRLARAASRGACAARAAGPQEVSVLTRAGVGGWLGNAGYGVGYPNLRRYVFVCIEAYFCNEGFAL